MLNDGMQKALTEAEGNMERAEEILRVKLGNKASKAASRVTAEGVVASFIAGGVGALVELTAKPTSYPKRRLLRVPKQLQNWFAEKSSRRSSFVCFTYGRRYS